MSKHHILDLVEELQTWKACPNTDAMQDYLELLDTVNTLYEHPKTLRIAGLYHRDKSNLTQFLNVVTNSTQKVSIGRSFNVLAAPSTSINFDSKKCLKDLANTLAKMDYDSMPFSEHNWLTFECEPTNKYDRNAIRIKYVGEHVGYIPKEIAATLVETYTTNAINEQSFGIISHSTDPDKVYFELLVPKLNLVNKISEPKIVDIGGDSLTKQLEETSLIREQDKIAPARSEPEIKIDGIDFRDYTGFMRTVLEYATFAYTLFEPKCLKRS